MGKWLKKISSKKLQIEDNINNVSASDQKEKGRVDTSISSSSSTLQSKNNDGLIRFDKVAKKVWNYQEEYLKYEFASLIVYDEPQCLLCLEILLNDSMKPSQLARHIKN